MINVNDFKTGMTIKYEGNLFMVIEFQHVKPGKGAAFVRTKVKNLRTGATIEITFNSATKVELARIEKKPIVLEDGTLGVGQVLHLSLSFDHRQIDGATGQNAMNHIKRLLNNPELLLMEG